MTPLLYVLPTCILGIALIAAGAEGYLIFVGRVATWARLPLVIVGFILSLPSLMWSIIGLAAAALMIFIVWMGNRKRPATAV